MQEIFQKATSLIQEFERNHSDRVSTIELGENLRKACERIERSWSGSFAGWHGRMYFKNFEAPSIYEGFSGEWGGIKGIPEGWQEREPEEVKKEIERLLGNSFSIDEFERKTKKLLEDAEALRNEVIIIFSAFTFHKEIEKEKKLFDQIEKYSFGKGKNDFIKNSLPKTLMSRDSEAVRQGICIASWLYYTGIALEAISIIEGVEEFLKLANRFLRQIETKLNSMDSIAKHADDILSDLHPEIFAKCKDLYSRDTYAEAVEKSFKVVRDKLRILTNYETGSEAFGKGNLHILGAAAPNVDKDFNEAVKFLTMAIDRFRNEKSHTSDAKINDPIRAYEYMRLSSLAMNLLDQAEMLPAKHSNQQKQEYIQRKA